MRRNDALYRLIRSMSGPEKRYFKVFASKGGKEKKYLMLFDAISRQKEYDEEALKRRFRNEKFVRQFSVAKNYLYGLIMRSLRQFHAEETVEARLRTMLTDVRLLIDRGLSDQARSLNDRATAMAEKFQKPLLLFEALRLHEEINPTFGTDAAEIAAMRERQLETLDRLRELVERKILLYHISIPVKQGNIRKDEERQRLERLIADPLLSEGSMPSSLVGQIYYHWSHSTYGFLRLDYPAALEHVAAIIRLVEAEPDRTPDLMDYYLMALNNALVLYRRLGRNRELQKTVETMRGIAQGLMKRSDSAYRRHNVRTFASIYIHLLGLHSDAGTFDQGLHLAEEAERGLERFGPYLKEEETTALHLNLVLIYFGAGKLRRSLDHINAVLLERSPVTNSGGYYAAHLINLIVHFELKNYCLLKYMTPSTSRYLSSRNVAHKLERTIIDLFETLPKSKGPEDAVRVFAQTRDRMLELRNDPVEKTAFRYFGYVEWLESRILRRPYAEVVRESYRYRNL